jgi:FkbM family methyltransferase
MAMAADRPSFGARLRALRTRAGAAGAVRGIADRLEPPADRLGRRDEEHLRLLIAFALSPDSNCVDVGAHQGAVLAEMVRVAPQGRHVAFEPIPELAARLADRFPTVDVRAQALSNRSGTAEFFHVTTLPSHSGLRERDHAGVHTTERIDAQITRLDEALPEDFVPALIKIDVEGAEAEVIEGALGTITAHRPITVFEHGRGGADHYGTTPGDIHDLLCTEARLRLFDLEGNGPYDLPAFQRAFDRGDPFNWVARA